MKIIAKVLALSLLLIFIACTNDRSPYQSNENLKSANGLVNTEPEKVGMSGDRLSRIDNVIQQYIDSKMNKIRIINFKTFD